MLYTYIDIHKYTDKDRQRSHSFHFKMLAFASQALCETQRYFAQITKALHAVRVPLKPFKN